MRRLVPLVLILFFAVGPCLAAEKPVIDGEDDEINYSIGHQIGRDLVRQELKVNPELLLQGIMDAANGQEPMIPFEQMIDKLAKFKERIVEQSKKRDQAVRVLGERFLAANKTKEGVVTLESGLQYRVLKEGKGKKPKASDQVRVNYLSKDINGKVFDTNYVDGKATPVQFKVSDVIPGWLEALQLMGEGAKWELVVPYQLAFKDATPLAGQTVIFEVELVEVVK